MLLVANGFFGNLQNPLQHDLMQLHHVELALAVGDRIQSLLDGPLPGSKQVGTLARYSNERGSILTRLPQQRRGAAAFRAQIDPVDMEETPRGFEHSLTVVGVKTLNHTV